MTVAVPRGLATDGVPSVDPVTYEIVRHRLWGVADEMATTLIRTAGSHSITDVNDFLVAVFTAGGEIALGGWGGNRHVSCTAQACKGLLERFPESEIEEDDVFLLNDPYVAAIHQQDVYVLSPVHVDGVLIAWVCNFTHLPDIGGIDPGWSPRATDVRQEGLRVPGLKLAERGVLREDVWNTLLNMTREPEMNALQLKAQIAANNTGKEKLRALVAKVGAETYLAIVAQMMAYSERALRARLRRLPDGTWRTREYFDTADRVYTIELAMTKAEDELHFDFTGTSEQAPNFINCTYWGTRGGIFVSVSSMLGHGLPWTEGLLKPLRLTVPEGSLLNARFPAPVSMGTVAASRMATIASWNTVSKMLAMTDETADELSGPWAASSMGLTVSGVGRDQRYFVFTPFADLGGGGGRRYADGINTCDASSNPKLSKANIETIERAGPLLYLFRRQLADSGGPGTFRGGVGSELAWTTHKAPTGRVNGVLYVSGMEPAMSHGLFGGWPGGNTYCEVRSDSAIRAALGEGRPVDDPTALGGTAEPLPPQGLVEVDQDAIFYARADGGGGIGDPLLRAPERVLADVQAQLVTVEQAQRVYGVVLDPSESTVDHETTTALRARLRHARLTAAPPRAGDAAGGSADLVGRPVRYDLEADRATCADCGYVLGALQENWKERAQRREVPMAELGPLWGSRRFVLRSFDCPACAALLDTEMTLPEAPPIWEFSRPTV
jgi:N-methylhydantoinase B